MTGSRSAALFREYAMDREIQRILTVVVSMLQSLPIDQSYNITNIGRQAKTKFNVTAIRDLDGGSKQNHLLIDVLPPTNILPIEQWIPEHLERSYVEPERNSTVDRVLVIRSSDRKAALKEIGKSLHNSIIWEMDELNGVIRIASGNHFDRQLGNSLKDGYNLAFDNFPNPYFPEMNPLLKLHFLTLNFNRRGLHNKSAVLEDAVRIASSFSIFGDLNAINTDFSSLLNTLLKIGIATGSSRISFPWSRTRTERAFIRRYYRYVEKASKTSLYDYDSFF
ncbi:MAG: hypothetical protein AAE987_01290 [Thermoplasmataceae archaeon]|jgi:hypothetical protein